MSTPIVGRHNRQSIDIGKLARFGGASSTNLLSPASNAISLNLRQGNHWILDLSGESSTVTVTVDGPSDLDIAAGTITIKHHASAPVDVTWATTGEIASGAWIGTEPTWDDAGNAGERSVLSWVLTEGVLLIAHAGLTGGTF